LTYLDVAVFRQEYEKLIESLKAEETRWYSLRHWWPRDTPSWRPTIIPYVYRDLPDDINFWKRLQDDQHAHTGYAKAEQAIRIEITKSISGILIKTTRLALKSINATLLKQARDKIDQVFKDRQAKENQESWQSLSTEMRSALENKFDNTRYSIIP
jgi:hypothetical protein